MKERPCQIPKPKKLKGARAKGKTHENSFERYLKRLLKTDGFDSDWDLVSHCWFSVEDSEGQFYLEPDFYLVSDSKIILFECKRTYNSMAWVQLFQKYSPVLAFHYGVPVFSAQVFRGFKSNMEGEKIPDLLEFINSPKTGQFYYHHMF